MRSLPRRWGLDAASKWCDRWGETHNFRKGNPMLCRDCERIIEDESTAPYCSDCDRDMFAADKKADEARDMRDMFPREDEPIELEAWEK